MEHFTDGNSYVVGVILVAQSAQRLTTGWKIRGSNPCEARFRARPDRPWGPPSLPYNGYRVFSGGKVRPEHAADHSLPSMPWSWKSRAIPLLTLWTTTGHVTGTLQILPFLVGFILTATFVANQHRIEHVVAFQ